MSKPNILLLFCDQLRADVLGCYGHPFVATPAIDRLAAEGTVFESAYTPSPVCVPSRYSLISGREPSATGCVDNEFPMPVDAPTLMGALTDDGYRTHGVGKMHFPAPPNNYMGFQTRDIGEEFGSAATDDYLRVIDESNFAHVTRPLGQRSEMYYIPQVSPLPEEYHFTHWVADRSIDFLGHRDKSEPFFLWSSFIAPHPPFSPPENWIGTYPPQLMPDPFRPRGSEDLLTIHNRLQNRYKFRDGGDDRRLGQLIQSYYYASVSFVDQQIGRILEALDATGERENTIIILSADHGELLGDYGSYGKRSFLDAAARVPLIISGPGFPAGRRREPVSLIDVMPTLLSAAGHEPDDELDGVTLQGPVERESIFGKFQDGPQALYMVCTTEWKYYLSIKDAKEYLIDRRRDPQESRNLAYVPHRRGTLVTLRELAQGHFPELANVDFDRQFSNGSVLLGQPSSGEYLDALDVDSEADVLVLRRDLGNAPDGYDRIL